MLGVPVWWGFVPAVASSALLTGACATDPIDATVTAGSDAIGLPRDRPGRIMVDEGDETVPTPYGGEGSRRNCSAAARDIARLTAVIGPDREVEPKTEEEEEERSLWDRSQDLMTMENAEDLAADAYHDAIVGLNPVRPVIRFVGRASEIEREARQQRIMALKRRAYLRGLYDGWGCRRSHLIEVFEEYGLTERGEMATDIPPEEEEADEEADKETGAPETSPATPEAKQMPCAASSRPARLPSSAERVGLVTREYSWP